MKTYFNTIEAARRMGLSRKTLERMRLEGTGPCFVKLGRRVLYTGEELDRWAEENTFRSTAECSVKRRQEGGQSHADL